MAIYHMDMKVFQRSKGHSTVAAAAYRSGENLIDERTGEVHDYTKKKGVKHTEIMLPANAPAWLKKISRAELWNKIEQTETRKNAQLAYEIEVALPVELSLEEQKALMREYIQKEFISRGQIADFVIEWKKNPETQQPNPHAHIMITRRELAEDGFGQVRKDWFGGEFGGRPAEAQKKYLDSVRASWADAVNLHLERAGITEKVDHRSYEKQDAHLPPELRRQATKHVGKHGIAWERKTGLKTNRQKLNNEIKALNEAKKKQIVELNEYRKRKADLKKRLDQREAHRQAVGFRPDEAAAIRQAEQSAGRQLTHQLINDMLTGQRATKGTDRDLVAAARAFVSEEIRREVSRIEPELARQLSLIEDAIVEDMQLIGSEPAKAEIGLAETARQMKGIQNAFLNRLEAEAQRLERIEKAISTRDQAQAIMAKYEGTAGKLKLFSSQARMEHDQAQRDLNWSKDLLDTEGIQTRSQLQPMKDRHELHRLNVGDWMKSIFRGLDGAQREAAQERAKAQQRQKQKQKKKQKQQEQERE